MGARLPKKFWRVIVNDTGRKLRVYDRKSKTYAQETAALEALAYFRRQGVECELWESEPVVWKPVNISPPKDMDPLW